MYKWTMRIVNLIGRKFGQLTPIRRLREKKRGNYVWLFQCSCGNHIKLTTGAVSGPYGTKSCGCLFTKKLIERNKNTHRYGKDNPAWRGEGLLPGAYISHIQYNSRMRKIFFDVKPTQLMRLYTKQTGKCALSGLKISFQDNSASLDRINSKKGYIMGNVQWVHKDINIMKNAYPEKYFVDMCKLIAYNKEEK
jgi:hypothetical protein